MHDYLNNCVYILNRQVVNQLQSYSQTLDHYHTILDKVVESSKNTLTKIHNYQNLLTIALQQKQQISKSKLEHQESLLVNVLSNKRQQLVSDYALVKNDLIKQTVLRDKLTASLKQKDYQMSLLTSAMGNKQQHLKHEFGLLVNDLDNLNPLKAMKRGYVITSQNDKIIKSVDDIDLEQEVCTTYIDGVVYSRPVRRLKND